MPTRTLLFRSAMTVVAVGAAFASAPDLFAQSAVSIPRSAGAAPAGRLSDFPSLSADGRYVAFQSDSEDLVQRDGNGACDIFVYDNFTGFSELVSTGPGLLRADGDSMHAAISPDGRFVAFASDATNLVAPWMGPGVIEDVFDSNGVRDVFVYDRVEKRLLPVSITNEGRLANGESDHPALSADGRFVVFQSRANNLGAESGGRWQVYRHDLLTRETTLVSVDSLGQPAPGDNTDPVVSADGATVAFVSTGALVPHDTNGQRDVYIRRGPLADAVLASVSSGGVPGNAYSAAPSLSADGTRLAFESGASNLVPGDTNQVRDVFVRDFSTGLTRRVTADVMTGQSDAPSGSPAISGDGRRVAMATVATMNVRGMEGLGGLSSVVVVDLDSESVMLPSVGIARQQPMDFGAPALNALGDEVIFVGYSPIVNPEQGPRPEGLFRGQLCQPPPTITIDYEVMDIVGTDPTDTGSVGATPTVIAMKIGEELCLDINAVIGAGCAAADSLVLDQVPPPVIPPLPASRTTFFNGMTCAAPGAMTTLPIGGVPPGDLDTINAIMKFDSNPEDQNDPAAGEYQLRLTLTEIDGGGNPVRVLLRTINVSVATCDEPRFDEQGLQDFDFCFDDDPIMDDRFTAAASGSPTDPGSAFFRMYPGETLTYAFGFAIGERCDTMEDDTGYFVRAQNEVTDCPLVVDPRCTLGFDLLPDQITIVGIAFDVVGTGLIVLTPGDFPANPFPIDPADYAGFGVDAELVRQINVAFQIAPTVDDVGTTVVRWEFLDSTGESNEVETVIQVFDCPTAPICELLCFERTCDVPGTTPIEREEYPCKPVNDPCDEDGMGSTFEVVPSASGAAFSFRVRARYPGLEGDDQNCACDGGTVRLEIVDAEEGAPSLMFVGGVALPCPQMDGEGPAPTCDTPMMDMNGQFIVKTLADESESILACVNGVALNGQARPEPYRYVFRVTDEDTGLFSECCVDIVVCPPPVCDIPADLVTVDGESPIVNMDGSILVLPGQKLLFTTTATTECRSLGLSLDEFGSTRDTDGAGMMAPIAFDPFPAMNPNCTVVSTVPPTGPPAALPVSISEECGATGPRTISATATCTFDETFAGDIVVLRFRATDSCGRTVSDCDLTIRFAVPPSCEIKNTDECPAVERISVSPGDTVTFDVNFTSDVLSDLNWSVTGLPDGATLTPPPPPAPPAMGAFIPSPASTHFEWTPTEGDKGIYTLTFTVMDEFGQISDPPCIIEIEVCNPPMITIFEETPFCDSTERIQAAAGQEVSFKVGIDTDCRDLDLSNPNDGLDITWTAAWFKVVGEALNPIAPPGNAAFMPAPGADLEPPIMSMLVWTPVPADKDMIFLVRITATDECDRVSMREVTIAVCNPPTCVIADIVPEPCPSTGRVEVEPGDTVMFDFRTTAGCNDKQVTWCVTGLPASKNINDVFEPDPPCGGLVNAPLEALFTWTPGPEDKGVHTVTITVTDECGREMECDIEIAVCNPPSCEFSMESPVCDAAGGVNASPGEEISFKIDFLAAECSDENLTYTVEGLPTGAVLMPAPGTPMAPPFQVMFTWTPDAGDKGDHTIRFLVEDECGRDGECEITVGVCNPPVCEIRDVNKDVCADGSLPGVYLLHPGQKFEATLFASSECEVNRLNWSTAFCLDGVPIETPSGVTLNPVPPLLGVFEAPPVSSLFCWTPTDDHVSDDVYTFKFMVEDECGRQSLCEIDILVCPEPVCRIFDVDILNASMEVVEEIDPFEENCSPFEDPIRLMIGETLRFDFCAQAFCPCGDPEISYSISPDPTQFDEPGTISFPDPTPVGDELCSTFEWTIGSDVVGVYEITFTVTDSLDKPPVQCCIKIFIPSPCIEDCPNDTDTCETAYFIDPNEGECGPYYSGLLEPSIAPGCEPDTYLVLFDKFVQYVNENDNSSMVGNGKASALYGVTTANGLINDGAGNLSLRVGVTGYPDGRIRPFEGLAQNGPHNQKGEFELKIIFKDAGGNPILDGVIMPQGYPYTGPTIYRDEFITGMEAFKLSFQAPAGTVTADIEIDNTVGEREVCDDVDFIRYINLVPLCEYCITQTGGLDENCEPANIRIGWFDKDCEEAILSDCDSGPFGQAQICVVADTNGVIVIGITGCDDEDFDGLSDAPMPFVERAPPVCPDPPPGHGVCACYTICILPNQPHPVTGESTLASSEFQSLGRSVSGRSVGDLRDALRAADLNMDGVCDTADLGILMFNWQRGQGR